MKNIKHDILLGLTTTPRSDWRKKTEEIDKYGIKEVSLFPTFLKIKERKELYSLLEKTCLERIPHVHLRDDMEKWELEYFTEKYQTEVFNTHPYKKSLSHLEKVSEFKKKIFVENAKRIDNMFLKIVKECGGICLDIAHYHGHWIVQKDKSYDQFADLLKKFPVGCCHISEIRERPVYLTCYASKKKSKVYSEHYLNSFEELDYVKDYIKYIPRIVSIELQNSFKKQLEVKKYLEKIL